MQRSDGRESAQARPCVIETDFMRAADGSCLIATGDTRVICSASVEESVPPFLRDSGRGWVTAEYAMLPASTGRRKPREFQKRDGRSVEIQRLIGRSLRQAVDLSRLGARTITLDCDVLQADGGTRTASVTGAYVALALALHKLLQNGILSENPMNAQIAAISAGLVDDVPLLDLCYIEDSRAQADMNLVMDQRGRFIELQSTGEGRAFSNPELTALLDLGRAGVRSLMRAQRTAIGDGRAWLLPKPALAVATGNAHKLRELSALLGGCFELVGMREAGFLGDVEETGETFRENAIIKAEAVARATGMPTLADDSGLVVDALGGAPGVHSARYAGEHGRDAGNRELLLANMRGRDDRRCAFVCAMALALPGAGTRVVEGRCEGTLMDKERGEGGFGYDSLFLYGNGKTFAELSDKQKNSLSHRARAAEKMLALLAEAL